MSESILNNDSLKQMFVIYWLLNLKTKLTIKKRKL